MAISINWYTKVIFVPKSDLTLIQASPTEIREMDLNWFRLSLDDLEDDVEGMPFPDTHIHVPPFTFGGVTLGRAVNIINDYTVTFEDGQYAVNLVGANSNVADRVNVNQVSVRSANSAGLVTSAAIEFGEYGGAVTVSVTGGESGSIYPIGTLRRPSNNFQDTMIIANSRGFSHINLITDATFTTGDNVANMTITGINPVLTHVTIETGADVANCEFKEMSIDGVLDGGNLLRNCVIGKLDYVNGEMHECRVDDEIILGGGAEAYLYACYSGIFGLNVPTINMGGSGQSLALRAYTGGITITNLNGDNNVSLDIAAGQVNLDSSITNGSIVIRGSCKIIDNSNGLATVEMDAVQITETAYNGKASIDVLAGGSGALYPWGTNTRPVNNLSDAMDLISNYDLSGFLLKGTIVLSMDIENLDIKGVGVISNNIIVGNGFSVDHTRFNEVLLTGSFSGEVMLDRCFVSNANMSGIMDRCIFVGTIYPEGSFQARDVSLAGYSSSPIVFDFSLDATATVQLSVDAGGCQVDNMSATNIMQIKLGGGMITVDGSCTGGTIVVVGDGEITDNSSGAVTIVNNTSYQGVADSVFEESISSHVNAGTFGLLLQKVLGLSQENIFIDNTVYDDDGQLVSSRVRVFDTKAHCDAASDGGSETTGLIATYDQTTVWEAVNQFMTYKQTVG